MGQLTLTNHQQGRQAKPVHILVHLWYIENIRKDPDRRRKPCTFRFGNQVAVAIEISTARRRFGVSRSSSEHLRALGTS
jgi:hypothetical protein